MTFPKYDPSRPLVSIDSETGLIETPGLLAPRASVWAFAWRNESGEVETEIMKHAEGARETMRLLEGVVRGEWAIAGANFSFDMAVLMAEYPDAIPLVFDAYEAGGIHDTQFAEQLNDIAQGLLRSEWSEEKQEYTNKKSYGLENLARIHLGQAPYKDEYRLRYGEWRDTPLHMMPPRALEYPKQDVKFTLLIAELQREVAARIPPHDPLQAALAHTCRTYLALYLVSAWGSELDPEAVDVLNQAVDRYSDSFVPELIKNGLLLRTMRGKNAGKLTKKKKALQQLIVLDFIARGVIQDASVEQVLADPARFLDEDYLTDGGKSGFQDVKAGREILIECVDKRLQPMAHFLEADKIRTSWGKPMKKFGRGPLHSRYGIAETGRTTCSGGPKNRKTGIGDQTIARQLPKELAAIANEMWGSPLDVRACRVPRPGYVFSSTDYSALESCTWAQSCIWLVGYSSLADALNNDIDPHALFATDLVHASYDDVLAGYKAGDERMTLARQRSKVGNFGYPGGMGYRKFQKYAKGQGVILSLEECKAMHGLFRKRWDEAIPYFELASNEVNGGGSTLVGLLSGMVRGGVGYTDWCNGNFQELAAFGATKGLYKIVRECYDKTRRSALFGSRVWAFVHDENLAEHPVEAAHEAATRLGVVQVEAMQETTPDVKSKAEPALMDRWYKNAKTVRDKHGILQVWAPEGVAA